MQPSWHAPVHCTLSLITATQLQTQLSSAGSPEYVRHNVLGVQLPQAALPWIVDAQTTGLLVTPNVPKAKHKCPVSPTHCGMPVTMSTGFRRRTPCNSFDARSKKRKKACSDNCHNRGLSTQRQLECHAVNCLMSVHW